MRFCIIFYALAIFSLLLTVEIQCAENTYTNSIGMEFILIPSGSFTMGAKTREKPLASEMPQHQVTISKPFYLGKYEVTQAQWAAVMGTYPSRFKGETNPVESVSWDEVQTFIVRLNEREEHDRYRLPTEAEWEYAARAGTTGRYSFGDDADNLGRYAWCGFNSGMTTHPVGQKEPNAWGLHDMIGNVTELVQDWLDILYYSYSPRYDPKGPSFGSMHMARGGIFFSREWDSRIAVRQGASDDGAPYIGFRLLLSLEEQ